MVSKNNCEELASFAKNIGSNFFLTNRHLSADYKLGFNTLFLELSRSTPTRARLADSVSEPLYQTARIFFTQNF